MPNHIRDYNEVLSGTYKIIDGYPRRLNSVTASKEERKEKKRHLSFQFVRKAQETPAFSQPLIGSQLAHLD